MKTDISSSKFAQFFGLLKRLPHANKEELVWAYSNMLTTSLKEFYKMRPGEFDAMLIDLEKKMPALSKKEAEEEIKKYRSAILHRLQKYGLDTTNWSVVNAFMSQPKIAGKPLYKMTIDDMKALIPKMESMLAKDAVKQVEAKHLMACN